LWEQNSKTTITENNQRYSVLSQLQIARKNRYADRHVSPEELATNSSVFQASSPLVTDDNPCCAICLDAFADGDEIRVLDCDHCFHKFCIDTWLLGALSEESTYTSGCPTCRRAVSSRRHGSCSSTSSSQSRRKKNMAITVPSQLPIAVQALSSPLDLDAEALSESEWGDGDAEAFSACGGISFNTFLEIGAFLHAEEGCSSPCIGSINSPASSSDTGANDLIPFMEPFHLSSSSEARDSDSASNYIFALD